MRLLVLNKAEIASSLRAISYTHIINGTMKELIGHASGLQVPANGPGVISGQGELRTIRFTETTINIVGISHLIS